jgi:hypothetical protein
LSAVAPYTVDISPIEENQAKRHAHLERLFTGKACSGICQLSPLVPIWLF